MNTNTRNLFSFQKRDVSKKVFGILENGTEVIVPLCPDYVPGRISDGVSDLMQSAVNVSREIQEKYPKNHFVFLIADTEFDILNDFNQKNILASREKLSLEVDSSGVNGNVTLFSLYCNDWHERQYKIEGLIHQAISCDKELDYFLYLHEGKRKERYSKQYGDNIDSKILSVRSLQIRHYAQYMLLSELMLERNQHVLVNYQTENLRAVTKYHVFLPRKKKVELIVY
jgi:hypothetical protein